MGIVTKCRDCGNTMRMPIEPSYFVCKDTFTNERAGSAQFTLRLDCSIAVSRVLQLWVDIGQSYLARYLLN